jgi:hypothetical protein
MPNQSLLAVAEQPETPALVPNDPSAMFERLARDPNASVDKIERLMAMVERAQARAAESAFNAAMSAAQSEMRPVAADASNPQTRSKYASYEALDLALRPIYTKHGFGLSFDTGDAPGPDVVRVLCYATHGGGHKHTYKLDMPADGKGAKGGDVMTKTHAVGSAMSYGMRYLLKMIFNVAVGEDDDDGNRAAGSQVRPEVKAPAGFDAWWTALQAAASGGTKHLGTAWNASRPEFRNHVMATNRPGWEALKRDAAAVKA